MWQRPLLFAAAVGVAVFSEPLTVNALSSLRDKEHVRLAEEVRALWSRNGSFGLAQRCIAVQLLSYRWFIRFLAFMADKQEVCHFP
jgi:hypothetical protein